MNAELETSRLIQLSEFYGHCQGLLDIRDGNWISDFDVVLRLHELVAEYEIEQEKVKSEVL